jgi:hypothetical protein
MVDAPTRGTKVAAVEGGSMYTWEQEMAMPE